jgi:hypothetical protein
MDSIFGLGSVTERKSTPTLGIKLDLPWCPPREHPVRELDDSFSRKVLWGIQFLFHVLQERDIKGYLVSYIYSG